MKKTLATVAAGVLTAALVGACSAPTPAPVTAPTSTSASAATSEADLAGFGLSNASGREVIDTLDRTNRNPAASTSAPRPATLPA